MHNLEEYIDENLDTFFQNDCLIQQMNKSSIGKKQGIEKLLKLKH